MKMCQVPLIFHPVYKDYIWGGHRISEVYARRNTPAICAESWEVSAHPEGTSVVAQGRFAGRRLDDLAAEFGVRLMGTRVTDGSRFPLLFKLIDARDQLSVQVHPNTANAALTAGDPKTEMWYVLDRTVGARLYAGLRTGVTPETLRGALTAGTADQCLVELAVSPGEALFIPGGLVHAIGSGCLIYEVQQSSNTTYRLYDWNRVGTDGKPRPLHIEESFKTIDWTLCPPKMVTGQSLGIWTEMIACPFFTLRKLALSGTLHVPVDGTSFHVLFVEKGPVRLVSGGVDVTLDTGMSVLIPADAEQFELQSDAEACLLVTTL